MGRITITTQDGRQDGTRACIFACTPGHTILANCWMRFVENDVTDE